MHYSLRGQSAKTTGEQGEKKVIGCIASGPSACKKDAEKIQEICDQVICVNDSWRLLPGCDAIWATDHRWWSHHISDITRDYDGECWTQDTAWPAKDSPESWGINVLKADTSAGGLARDKDTIHTGRNSGYAAIGLAYHMGASRILLLGYDMMMSGDQRHWFGAHPDGLEVNSNYASFIAQFKTINPAEYGIEIWNCTRKTALTCFPCYNLDDL